MGFLMKLLLISLIGLNLDITATHYIQRPKEPKSFTIGYNDNTFLKDGQPFRYISGSMHYFRVPQEYWEDRLTKMKAAGLNAVQTYIEWNSHEREPGIFNFEGNLDLVKFILTAQRVGLYVIIRAGPFIDAERDMGGLPYWLMTFNKNIVLRTMDPSYITYVDRWFSVLLPLLEPLLYSNGGPIIMAQVENEYGSYFACDRDYMAHLYHTMRKYLGLDVVLFTTDGDGSGYLRCGSTDGAYATVDFGSGVNVQQSFAVMRTKEIAGPLVNSEYYTGWLDHWNYPHSQRSDESITKTLDEILAINASVNMYMFHGGTSFGFTSGSNLDSTFVSCPTSYDYDAPLSEAGDLTSKYFAIQNVIKKYVSIPKIDVTVTSSKMKFGPVTFTEGYPLLPFVKEHSTSVQSPNPLTFEELRQGYGFVLYETIIPADTPNDTTLSVEGIGDRGYVFVDGKFIGILSREEGIHQVTSEAMNKNQVLSILVENQGRIAVGTHLNDTKGILGNALLNNEVLINWLMYPVRLSDIESEQKPKLLNNVTFERGIFYASFVVPNGTKTDDTFLKLDGWNKGVAYLNGRNLGKYWPVAGPQVTLYVPGIWFKPNPLQNDLVLFEQDGAPCLAEPAKCSVQFVDVPILNGTTKH